MPVEAAGLTSLVIITGMSGSGKHTVFKAFEDLGYFCVDNLPTALVPRLVQMSSASGGKIGKLAVVIDVRLRESLAAFEDLFADLRRLSPNTTVIFVDASDEVLARRYSETRRVHPLARDKSLLEGVRAERRQLADLRSMADVLLDTTRFTVHDLRNYVYQNFQHSPAEDRLILSLVSFGFKYGIPHNSDMLFDVRFLPNPHFILELQEKTGNDPEVLSYLLAQKETVEVLERIHDMLEYLLPKFAREGKKYLTVAIGCTGGKHRSVAVANELGRRLKNKHRDTNVVHRDLLNS